MEKIKIDGVDIYKWKCGASTFRVNVENGARLMDWNISISGKNRSIIYWKEGSVLCGENFGSVRGGNPILFPFAGASFADGVRDFWKTPDGKILPMKLHGYASSGKFEIVEISDGGFKAKFLPDEKCREAYPYSYDFFVEYSFKELSMLCKMTLVNHSEVRIPWGAGTHFYFTMPWSDSLTCKNYRIVHDAKKLYKLGSKAGTLEELKGIVPTCFDDELMCNLIHCKLKNGVVKFGTYSGEEDISLIIDGGGKVPVGTTVVTWTEYKGEPFYCVEPWMSPPFSASKPLRFIEPYSSSDFSVEVRL